MAWRKIQKQPVVDTELSSLKPSIQRNILNVPFNFAIGIWLVVAVSLIHISAACTTPPSQVSALNDLYVATNGNNWVNNTNWGVGDPCNSHWYGVTCWGNCTIQMIGLNDNNLSGTIPSTIGNLVNLQRLYLYDNYLNGTIPSTVGNLVNFQVINLESNNLSGTIPSTIGNLAYLQDLELSYNNLSGTIPSTIGSLGNLQGLYLSYNNLSGTIPSTIGSLSNLQQLDLSYNNLSGTIPSPMGSLNNLEVLHLENNNLSGTIPSTIGNLVNLYYLWLNDNQLNGTVPWKQNPGYYYFNISNNQFSCPLPSWCSPPPTGNGLCAPCVNVTTSQLLCCYYSDDGCQDITFSYCMKGPNCPTASGLQTCGQVITSNCDKCFSNKKGRVDVN